MVKFTRKYYNKDPKKIKLWTKKRKDHPDYESHINFVSRMKALAGKERHPGLEWCLNNPPHLNNLNSTPAEGATAKERNVCPKVGCKYSVGGEL